MSARSGAPAAQRMTIGSGEADAGRDVEDDALGPQRAGQLGELVVVGQATPPSSEPAAAAGSSRDELAERLERDAGARAAGVSARPSTPSSRIEARPAVPASGSATAPGAVVAAVAAYGCDVVEVAPSRRSR